MKKNRFLIYIALFLIISGIPIRVFWLLDLAFISMVFGCLLTFILIVEWECQRVTKGIVLIIFGIFAGILYPEILFTSELLEKINEEPEYYDLSQKLKIFTNLIIFSCSGAGGSIIAAHADRSVSDRDNSIICKKNIDFELEKKVFSDVQLLKSKIDDLYKIVKYQFILLLAFFLIVLISMF